MLPRAGHGGNPPWDDVSVPKDRKQDRHATPARIIRPVPPELWTKLGERAGERGRSYIISQLIEGYLDGRFVIDEEVPPVD